MSTLIDLSGQRFGRLTVIKRADNHRNRTAWLCKCDCGNEKIVCSPELCNGDTKSCGCYRKENPLFFMISPIKDLGDYK